MSLCSSYFFGQDTGNYSFGYMAAWLSRAEKDALKKVAHLIQSTANKLIQQLNLKMRPWQTNQDLLIHYVISVKCKIFLSTQSYKLQQREYLSFAEKIVMDV